MTNKCNKYVICLSFLPFVRLFMRNIQTAGGEIFRTLPDGSTQPPCTMGAGFSFPGGKAAGAWGCPLTPLSPRLKN